MPKKTSQNVEQLSLQMEPTKNCSFAESSLSNLHIFNPEAVYLPTYIRKNGMLFTENSLQWLKSLQAESIDMVFADPPYNIKRLTGTNLTLRKSILNGRYSGFLKYQGFLNPQAVYTFVVLVKF